MLLALAIWSTISAAAAADGLDLPPWPAGLQAEVRADGWSCLAPATADAMHSRLELLDRFPDLARTVCNTRVNLELTKLSEKRDVDDAAAAVKITDLEQHQATTWKTAKSILAGAAGGAALIVILQLVFGPKVHL